MRILITSSYSRSLINFRLNLIIDLLSNGHEVIALGNDYDQEVESTLSNINVKFITIPFNRNSISISDLDYLRRLYNLIRREEINLIIPYTIKPVIYSSIASIPLLKIKVIALITGLGKYAAKTEGKLDFMLNGLITKMYQIASRKVDSFIFQNQDDIKFFISKKINVPPTSIVTAGSGVDMKVFKYRKLNLKKFNVLMISRLIPEKGISEFLDSIKILIKKNLNISFTLIGQKEEKYENHKFFGTIKELLVNENFRIVYNSKNVLPFLYQSSLFVLPTKYREGVPRTLLEALAVGRPIITTNNVGSKETVINNKNGYLIPPGDPYMLAEKIEYLYHNPDLCNSFGLESFKLCRQRFDVNLINNDIINLINNRQQIWEFK